MKAAGFFCHQEYPQYKKVPALKILLEHGADVNAKDESGKLHTVIVTISKYIYLCVSKDQKCTFNTEI